ncbi:MAG TPA: thiamine pyrophosphate-dependent dehydrogenase E1 component subunit alpha [Anaerolineae bacterium]|nr:thiamine pyrophosphate-dependent dehydrogenase E1 component subunit alpha [Anaerolineae bacterium]HMR65816.1 thiamine pyrophosphate-dependent dehydrogenase E1 component subunit alpha [Anaerolineae bacterium]
MALDQATLLELYRTIVKIRTFEERVGAMYYEEKLPAFDIAAGPIPGEMHLYSGQEAVAAGVCAHLRLDDPVTSTHRPHGHLIAKGVDLNKMMAEIFGKKTGLCQGKGGHMHLFDPVTHFGCGGIVGGGIPHAVGAALAIKKRGEDRVAVAFFGEGAANIGAFHESVNIAALWKLPVVFVVEDNLYAISVPKTASTSVRSNAERGAAYGIPAVQVDGQNAVAVYEAAREAIARARRGEGPSLIEAICYRFRGHFEGDAEGYLNEGEKADWKEKDPINILGSQMKEQGWLTEAEAEAIQAEMTELVAAAEKFARESPYPAPEEALEHVFA